MKIYCRQIAPEFQENSLFYDDCFPDNIAVFGNRDYNEHLPKIVETCRKVLDQGELADILGDIKNQTWYKNATEAINDFLPKPEGAYSPRAIHDLKKLIDRTSICSCSEKEFIFCEILSIVTGKKWDYKCIHGCCQSEWNTLYYPIEEMTEKGLDRFETEYFNLGSAWIIHEGDEEPQSPEDIRGVTLYCHSNDTEQIKAEIAEAIGEDSESVVLYKISRFVYMPVYEEAV